MKRPATDPAVAYVRVGLLRHAGGSGNGARYGQRCSVPVAKACAHLVRYSLIIPAVTTRGDIPSGEREQRQLPWLWGALAHVRYFGVLDLDPVWPADVLAAASSKGALKAALAEQLAGASFGEVARDCEPFGRLLAAVRALLAAAVVPVMAFFSGGGGFRVLIDPPPEAAVAGRGWYTVTWGEGVGAVFLAERLRALLAAVAPNLGADATEALCAAADRNVYDTDKGIKPDLLPHFDTGLWPARVTADFAERRASRTDEDAALSAAIGAYWARLLADAPAPETVPRLAAPLAKQALLPPVPAADASGRIYLALRTRQQLAQYLSHLYPAATMARFLGLARPPSAPPYLAIQCSSSSSSSGGDEGASIWRHVPPAEVPRTAEALRQFLVDRQVYALHAGRRATGPGGSDGLERALVLDLDVADWECARPGSRALLCACAGKAVCRDCWVLVMLAAAVCRALVGDVLGLGAMLVVYSGGKGAHFHWASAAARALTETQRQHLVADWLGGGTLLTAVVAAPEASPLARVREAALAAWRALLVQRPAFLAEHDRLAAWLARDLAPLPTDYRTRPAADVWDGVARATPRQRLVGAVMHLAWPVVDAGVALQPGHLVKTPFAVHAATGRVALPLARAEEDTWDPAQAPSVREPHATLAPRVAAAEAVLAAWLLDGAGLPGA